MSESKLRAVGPDEKPAPAKRRKVPKSISKAVESGTGRDVLASMRKALARKLDDGEVASNSIASAYKELRELDKLIRQWDAEEREEEARQDASNGNARRSFNPAAI